MKKFHFLIALLLCMFCFSFVGCGDPYANMEINVSEDTVVLYMNPSEENQSRTAEIEVSVSGVDTNLINQEISVKYLTTENVVTASSIQFDETTGKSTVTLSALSKGSASLIFVSKDNDKITSKTVVVQVVNLIEGFSVKDNLNVSVATGENLDLSALSLFQFSNDTDQTEMNYSILLNTDPRFNTSYAEVAGVSLTSDGLLEVDEDCLGGIVQILATSKYIPANASAEKVEALSKVFKVMVYRSFDESDIEIYMADDITMPINIENGLLLTRNDPTLNPQTIIAKVAGDVVTNFVYSVVSNTRYVTITPGTTSGLQSFMIKAEDSGEAVLTISATVVDPVLNIEYAKKSITMNVSCIRVVKEITLTAEEVSPVTNDTIEVDVYETSQYDTAVLGTFVGISVTPKEVENRSYVVRIISTDGETVTDQNRTDIVVKVVEAGNTNGKRVEFGTEITDTSLYISYFNSGAFTSNFVLAVVANSFDERLSEVVAYIKCNIQMAVGDIVIADNFDTMLCIGDEITFSFRSNGESDRFNITFSTPGILSITPINDQRTYKIVALKDGQTILTVRAKGTGNYKTVTFQVYIILESVSLSVPNHSDIPKITEHIYGTEVVDDQGLLDPMPLQSVAIQTGAVFVLTPQINPSNATLDSITFESNNPGFVSIDSTGRIVAYGMPCTATISVTFVYQVRDLSPDGASTWTQKTSIRSFNLVVYKPITSVSWFGGTNRAFVEVWDYNSLSKTDQQNGKATVIMRASVYPSTATSKDFQWKISNEEDERFVTIETTTSSVTITGHLPLDFDGDEYQVTINGWVTEYGIEHSVVCIVTIKKPQHLSSVGVVNYDNTQGIYLESAGKTGVSNAYWDLIVQTSPFEALSNEVSYVLFNAELDAETNTVNRLEIAKESEKLVEITEIDGVTHITPITNKRGYTIIRIIPSSLLNQEIPAESEFENLENAWVNAVLNATVYCDVWVMVADGSVEAPFQILDVKDFCDIEVKGLDKNYVVKRDIDFSSNNINGSQNWISIGGFNSFTGSIKSFKYGSSDTMFKLYGLKINTETYTSTQWNKIRQKGTDGFVTYLGLFGKNSGNIENLEIIYDSIILDFSTIESTEITPEIIMFGAVVGQNEQLGTVKNVSVTVQDVTEATESGYGFIVIGSDSENRYNTSSVHSLNSYIGGVVGYNIGTTKTCSISADFSVEVSSDPIALGGIVGLNKGKVDGGIVTTELVDNPNGGYDEVEVITKTSISVNIDMLGSSSDFLTSQLDTICYGVGGIVGVQVSGEYVNSVDDIATILNYDANGFINASTFDNVGGIVGSSYGKLGVGESLSVMANINNCSASTHVYGASNVGGIAGYNNGGSFYNTFYECYQAVEVKNDYSNTSVRGNTNVGGFIGKSVGDGQIEFCYASSYVPLTFVFENGLTLTDEQFRGDVIASNGSSDSVAGGFIGYLDFNAYTQGIVDKCFARMSVGVTRGIAGGFIGYANVLSGLISNSYAISNVICTSNAADDLGGFIGKINFQITPSQFIDYCYSVSGLSADAETVNGIYYGKYNDGDDVLYNSKFNFIGSVSRQDIIFLNCYYADVNISSGKNSFGAVAVPLLSMKGQYLGGNNYINAISPAFGVDNDDDTNWFNADTAWVPYSGRVNLNNNLPVLYNINHLNPMISTDLTNLNFSHVQNLYTQNGDKMPVFFKFEEGKIVAVLNSMTSKIYSLSDVINLITEPEAGLVNSKVYVTSSDLSVVSVVNVGVATYFANAKLVFNKTGTVFISVMSATNFNVNISFQICVIAGFSNFELHQSGYVSGDDNHTISIKIGEADILVPYLKNNTNFADNIYIYYKVSVDTALESGMTYDKFAQFVNYDWQVGENCFYVKIPLSNDVTHLLEALNSTAELNGLMLNILASLQLEVNFYNNENNLIANTITFDEQTIKDLFRFDSENGFVTEVDDKETSNDESVVTSLDTLFKVRVYKGVSGAEITPSMAEIETSVVQPVMLTVYTDATDVLLNNLGAYVSAKLEINGTTVVSSLRGEQQILLDNFVSDVSPLTHDDILSLVNQIAYFVTGETSPNLADAIFVENANQSVVFQFYIGLYEKYLTENVELKYTFVIYDDLYNEVDRQTVYILLKPTEISTIEVLHYLSVDDMSQGKADSEEISSGQTGLLVVNVYNSYSDFDYITVTSSFNANDVISFVQVQKNADLTRFTPLTPSSEYIDAYTIKGVKTQDYSGSFYFTTTLGAGIPKGTPYTLTIRAYKKDSLVATSVQTKRLYSRYVPYMNISLDSRFEGNIVARGTEVQVNMQGSVTNSTVKIDITGADANIGRSSIIANMGSNYTAVGYRYTPTNEYEAENGRQVSGAFNIYFGPEATCPETGIEVTATTTTVSSTGGTESVVYTMYLKLVDFIVESLQVTDVANGAMSPSMENIQDLDMYFNIQPSSLEMFNDRYSTGSDTSLSGNLSTSQWSSLNPQLSMLGMANMVGDFKSGVKLADEKGYVLNYSTAGGTDVETRFDNFCGTVLFQNCQLTKETIDGSSVGAWQSLKNYYPNQASRQYMTYKSCFKNPTTNMTYDFVYGYAFTNCTIFGFDVEQNNIIIIAKVVEETDEFIGNISTSFSNIREAVATTLSEINTYGEGFNAIWYFRDNGLFKSLTSTNNTCPNFDVTYTEGRGYSISGKTLNQTAMQAGLKIYYEYSDGVFRFKWKDITSTDEINYANVIELSTAFTVQFRNTSTLDRPTPIYDETGLRQMVDGGDYMLMADIIVSNWEPVTARINSFDGNGHIISVNGFSTSSLTSSGSVVTEANIGFFDTVYSDAIIKNLILDVSRTVYVNARNTKTVNFGFIAGVNDGGIITNCEVITTLNNKWYDETMVNTDTQSWLYYANLGTNEIDANAETVFEQIKNLIKDDEVANKPTIASTFLLTSSRVGGEDVVVYTGGLVGVNDQGYITNSRVGRVTDINIGTTSVTTTQGINIFSAGNLGGLVGFNSGVISSSYFANGYLVNTTKTGVEVSVGQTSSSNTTGGLVAYNNENGLITTSYVVGMENSITATSDGRATLGGIYSFGTIGGFVNTNEGVIENCYSNISISTQRATGGFVYNNAKSKASIKYSYSMSPVTYYSSNNGPFTGIDKEGQVLNVGSIEYCYYLIDTSFLVNEDEPAVGLSSEIVDGKSEWNDPNGSYFVGYVLTLDPDSENAKMATWVMPDSSSYKKGPQLVAANTIAVSSRKNDYLYQAGYNLGSKTNPYLVANASQFNQILSNLGTSTNNVRLVADINFDGNVPLTSTQTALSGVICGNGMRVSNYSLSLGSESTSYNSLGLFKSITGSIVSNLTLEIETEFSSLAATYVGGLAGQIDSSLIENIKVCSYNNSNAKITARNVAGGLAGLICGDSQIENISSYISVYVDYATIQTNGQYRYRYLKAVEQTSGPVVYSQSNYYSYAGGIAGVVTKQTAGNDPTIVNCLVGDNITIRADIVGGVFGVVDKYVITSRLQFIVNGTNSSQKLWAENFAGGLVGENRGKITQSYISLGDKAQIADDQQLNSDQNVVSHLGYTSLFQGETTNAIGGLVGVNRGSVVTNNSSGTVQMKYYGVIETSYSRVAVVNENAQLAGGVVGLAVSSDRLEDADDASKTNQAMDNKYINVRNIFGTDNIYYLTGNNTDNGIYFGQINDSNVRISGSVYEVWTTGAVYAGGKAIANGGGYLFTDSAGKRVSGAGGFAGAFVDPMNASDGSISLALLNNQLTSTETDITSTSSSYKYHLGSMLGHVVYKLYYGSDYNADESTLTKSSSILFVKEPESGIFTKATASATGVSTVYTNQTVNINSVGSLLETEVVSVYRNLITLKEAAVSTDKNANAFSSITSDIWQKDETLESTIFPVIKMGKIVTQLSITSEEEFFKYIVPGDGGKYLLTRNLTITREMWGTRTSLTNGSSLPISGQLRGYVGNGDAATITLVGFCECQLKSFDSLFGYVSGFTLSNINFVFPQGIESTGETITCLAADKSVCGAESKTQSTNEYFGLLAYRAIGFSNFENLSIAISGANKNINVNNKSAVGAFVGYSENCTYTNLVLKDEISFNNNTYTIKDGLQSSFGGIVGQTNGKTEIAVGDFGAVSFDLTTARLSIDDANLFVGGFVGSSSGGSLKIDHSAIKTSITINAPYANSVYMGGIIGAVLNGGEISYCSANVNLQLNKPKNSSVTSYIYFGGIGGLLEKIELKGNSVTGFDDWNISTEENEIYAGGVAGKLTSSIVYGTNSLNHSGVALSNDANFNLKVGSSEQPLENSNIFFGGIVGEFEAKTSGTASQVPATSIIGQNAVLGDVEIYGAYEQGGAETQAYVGGIVGNITNDISNRVSVANNYCVVSENISLSNIRLFSFFNTYFGGIVGQSYFIIQNCASYGVLSYTSTGTGSDNIAMGGIAGYSACPLTGCYTTSPITQYGLDISRDNVLINAIVGKGATKGTLLTNCYYNFELSGVLDAESTATKVENVVDMSNTANFVFTGSEWTTRSTVEGESFLYPVSLAKYIDFSVGGNMVPVHADSYDELLEFLSDANTKNKIIIVNFDMEILSAENMDVTIQNCSRLLGNGVVLDYRDVNLTLNASTGQNIGVFSSIEKDVIVSGIYVWFGNLVVNANEDVENADENSINIGLFAGQNNGVLIDCVAGFMPQNTAIEGNISKLASKEKLDKTNLEVSTLTINMLGSNQTNKANIFVGGLVGQNNGAINMCWSYADIIINNYKYTSNEETYNAKYKLYVGGLVGCQHITGSTANAYAMGKISFVSVAGPTTSTGGTNVDLELGTFVGGVMGYDFAGCISYCVSVISFSLIDEAQINYVFSEKYSLLLGGTPSDLVSTTLFSCGNINTFTREYNDKTSGNVMSYSALKGINSRLNTNWMQSPYRNYGIPYLGIYKKDLSTGQGTEDSPYSIAEWQALCDVTSNSLVSSRYYVLTRNLYATKSTLLNGFIWLDGAGHTVLVKNIQNLSIGSTGYALFNTLSRYRVSNPVVQNLVVRYADFNLTGFENTINFGGIALKNDEGGVIQNCAVIGTSTTANANINFASSREANLYGGVVVNNVGLIEKCFTSLNFNVTFGTYGGIAGQLTGAGVISQCFTTGGVSFVNRGYYGGLVGLYKKTGNEDGIIDCFVKANTITIYSGSAVNVGALVGKAESAVSIVSSYFMALNKILSYNSVSGTFDTFHYSDFDYGTSTATSEQRRINGLLIGQQDEYYAVSNSFRYLHYFDPFNDYPVALNANGNSCNRFVNSSGFTDTNWATGSIWSSTNLDLLNVTPQDWISGAFLDGYAVGN